MDPSKLRQKTAVIIGHLDNIDEIRDNLQRKGHPLIQLRDVDSAINILWPSPHKPGERYQGHNLYVIGEDIPDHERSKLAEWLTEEGGGPYIYVGTKSRTGSYDKPDDCIMPQQASNEVVSILLRYLDKLW